MAKYSTSSTSAKVKKSGKKGKRFLDAKDAALDLANSIAGAQEDKSRQRSEKRKAAGPPGVNTYTGAATKHRSGDRTDLSSSRRMKVEETKALIRSKRAHQRKEKAKQRKDAAPLAAGTAPAQKDGMPLRKRVAFA